jgi:hypothetical protein
LWALQRDAYGILFSLLFATGRQGFFPVFFIAMTAENPLFHKGFRASSGHVEHLGKSLFNPRHHA